MAFGIKARWRACAPRFSRGTTGRGLRGLATTRGRVAAILSGHGKPRLVRRIARAIRLIWNDPVKFASLLTDGSIESGRGD